MNEWVLAVLILVTALWAASGLCTAVALKGGVYAAKIDTAARLLLLWGATVLGVLLAALWYSLGRPPMRTLGETRLWYAFLLTIIGLLVEWRLSTRALRMPMIAFGIVFILINIFRPEMLDRTLMPALQSPWFVPHVVVYMAAYAALGLSGGLAAWVLLKKRFQKTKPTSADVRLPALLVNMGLPFLTLGMAFGALWAKEAWGHYWSWDPKETWAFVSWAVYLGIIHLQRDRVFTPTRWLWCNSVAFLGILACWFLVNYLPAAAASIHTY